MPVRFKITLIFSLLVLAILAMMCSGIYYFSYQSRIASIKTRLTNRAITTASLLSQQELFDQRLIQRIDASTTISLVNKSVVAFNAANERVYQYSDQQGDLLPVTPEQVQQVRENEKVFFEVGSKEAIGVHYTDRQSDVVIFAAAEDRDGRENLRSLRNILLFSFLAGNILVIISGYFFSRSLLVPLKRISNDVRDISAQNLARRIETGPSSDEWHQLAATLNSLLDRLQESFEMQRRFIANASHELSTPLTAISSQLEISLSRERDAESYRSVMFSIFQDVQHLCKLTQALLEFAKASGNPGGLEITLIRMDEIILRLPAEATAINPDYTVRIDFENLPEQEEYLLVFGNEPLLFTAIKNIVLNACKYSPGHTASVVLATNDQQYITITVQDEGPGIQPDELRHIFQPFYRAGGAQPTSGFGLGLSLADRIIKLHKGTIAVVSEPGVGTTFSIRLPGASTLKKL
jgi:signal transduction histidine kinase